MTTKNLCLTCNQCEKVIEDVNRFSDIENDLDFCSQDCQTKWDNETKSWATIDQKFAEKEEDTRKIYRQLWKEAGLTYQDAQEWIKEMPDVALSEYGYVLIRDWKNYGLTLQEAKDWWGYDVLLVAYLKNKNKGNLSSLNPHSEKFQEKKGEFKTWSEKSKSAKEYLDAIYHPKQRDTVKELILNDKNLKGVLDLSDFVNLERLFCLNNELTDLKLPNQVIKQLTDLDIKSNNFPEQELLMFSQMINLKGLSIGNFDKEKIEQGIYNRFEGSLEPLKDLNKLEYLYINDTNIDSGLEYLPKSVKRFECLANQKENARVKKLEQALKGKVVFEDVFEDGKKEWEKDIDNFFALNRFSEIQKNIKRFFGGYSNQEIAKLKDPQQIKKQTDFLYLLKWAGRVVSLSGSALTLTDHGIIGGIVTMAYPFVDFGISEWETNFIKSNESKWESFIKDSKDLWNDYQELRDVLEFSEVFCIDKSAKDLIDRIDELGKKMKDSETMQKKLGKKMKDSGTAWIKLGKKMKDSEIEQIDFNSYHWFSKADQRDLIDKYSQLENKLGKKNYKSYLLWEEIQEVYEEEKIQDDLLTKVGKKIGFLKDKSDSSKDNQVTKNQFAQDLQKNWEDKKKEWGSPIIGRKTQWRRIGEILMELNEYYQGLDKNIDKAENKNLEKDHHIIDMENKDWKNIHSSFTTELQKQWEQKGFTYQQTKDWMSISPSSQQEQTIKEIDYYAWLRDIKNLTPEQVLNDHNFDFKVLKQEFIQYQQNKSRTIEILEEEQSTPLNSQSLNSSSANLLTQQQHEAIEMENLSSEQTPHIATEAREDDPIKNYERMKELEEAKESDQLIIQVEIPPK